jgi:hypothetical protein
VPAIVNLNGGWIIFLRSPLDHLSSINLVDLGCLIWLFNLFDQLLFELGNVSSHDRTGEQAAGKPL